jgi:hypothetical protein
VVKHVSDISKNESGENMYDEAPAMYMADNLTQVVTALEDMLALLAHVHAPSATQHAHSATQHVLQALSTAQEFRTSHQACETNKRKYAQVLNTKIDNK